MNPHFTQNSEIPSLAWTCHFTKGHESVHVEHGSSVDTGSDFFFEGAWSGEFTEHQFLENPCYGSGGRFEQNSIVLTPPDHILDRLFIYAAGEVLYVSNSLAMLMARADLHLRTDRADYPILFTEMLKGLTHHETQLPLKDGGVVRIWNWFHMRISKDLKITKEEKSRPATFNNFQDYERYVSSHIKAIFDNAQDPARGVKFTPMTTISSGYDSTAITALASDHGCNDAITFAKSRGKMGKQAEDDSGAEASEILKLNVRVYDRLDYRNYEGFPEIDGLGAGSEMISARGDLHHRILLTGFLGDTIWDRVPTILSTDFNLPTIAGHNLTELRLSTGFIMFPVPFLGGREHPSIIAISQSEEMKPWALMNDYDRPICRRIAEDRGIPRTTFGMKKKAAGVFFREEGLEATMTPQSYADYSAFRARETGIPLWRAQLSDKSIEVARFINSAFSKITKIVNKTLKSKIKPPRVPATPGLSSQGSVLFQWAIERLKARYTPPS